MTSPAHGLTLFAGSLQMRTDFQKIISSPVSAYDEGLRFFMGQGTLNEVLRKITKDLVNKGIDYNLIGAVALNQHGYRRFY